MVLGGIVLLVGGLIVSGYRGTVMVGGGLVLASLAGLELAVREHLAGYRSHSMLIAGVGATVTIIAVYLLAPGLPPGGKVAAGAAVFGLGVLGLRQLFKRRSGGASFRIGNFRG
jgi:hypothetical protein